MGYWMQARTSKGDVVAAVHFARMAMATSKEYQAQIQKLKWPGLKKLWEAVKAKDTPEWEPGKAFEYLVLRMFELDGADVRWPYSVPLFEGLEVEQIDGSLRYKSLYCLVESKDEGGDISIGPIAKMRNQLLRRPAAAIGLLFSSRGFTVPAVQLAHFTPPQTILLWLGRELEFALTKRKIVEFLEIKYRAFVDEGMPNFKITES